jgi:hypothetical protein
MLPKNNVNRVAEEQREPEPIPALEAPAPRGPAGASQRAPGCRLASPVLTDHSPVRMSSLTTDHYETGGSVVPILARRALNGS